MLAAAGLMNGHPFVLPPYFDYGATFLQALSGALLGARKGYAVVGMNLALLGCLLFVALVREAGVEQGSAAWGTTGTVRREAATPPQGRGARRRVASVRCDIARSTERRARPMQSGQ